MKVMLVIALAVVAACHIGAIPFLNLPAVSSNLAVKINTETFQFKGFRVLRRNDISACLVIRESPTTQINVRAVSEEHKNGNTEEKVLPILNDVTNIGEKVQDLCGSLKMIFLLNSTPNSGSSASASLNVERSFGTSSNGTFTQVIQSLFGVWSIPSLAAF